MDTVYSGKEGSCALLVLTERLSRKEIIEKMRDRTAISTVRALNRIERRFGALFPRVFQTITVDNGGGVLRREEPLTVYPTERQTNQNVLLPPVHKLRTRVK